jgi:two-component system CheB/CheR fusion protein
MAKPKLPARRAVARSGSHTPKAQGREPGSSAPDQQRETAIVFQDTPEEDTSTTPGFPVVGIGASAGGLEAFTRLLQYLPIETGMAFVLIQHLAPQHASILASLLSRATTMPVIEVCDGTPVEPNHVYVIPPNAVMSISRGALKIEPRPEGRGSPRPIDYFFRSLAAERKAAAIGVVLSGTDADGSQGLQAIREEGGIAIVQSESSAQHADMPRMAIAAGSVDLVLPPEEIARELERISQHPSLKVEPNPAIIQHGSPEEPQLSRIFTLLQMAVGVDFRGYKIGTIRRRIGRRIILQRQPGLEAYVSFLEAHRSEVVALYEDILINVTSFFRDPKTFLAIENQLLPPILEGRSFDLPIRVWVPGCSTGEEVYSIAMSLVEAVSKCPTPIPIQIFGTDLSERAISVARTGNYLTNQVSKVSPERLARFFNKTENGYRVIKAIREMCVFARQNICVDPPYSHLDMISCRNLLIYLGPALQRQAIATFHYALQPGRYLILGSSESLRGFPDLFSPMDKKHKLYRKDDVPGRASLEVMSRGYAVESGNFIPSLLRGRRGLFDQELRKTAERIVLSNYGPAWVIVHENLEIVHSHGDTRPYLQVPAGTPTYALLKMARESIRGELRMLLKKATEEGVPVKSKPLSDHEGTDFRRISLEVHPIANPTKHERHLLVLFFSQPEPSEVERQGPGENTSPVEPNEARAAVERLRQELTLNTQRLQTIIDDRDSVNQDLISANEEVQSSNEELQSINEELETSKEELQSSNEELNTVNEELQNRNQELSRLSDDLANLLSSTSIPILMLDNELRIRRITSAAERLLNVRSSDVGRPITQIRLQLSVEDVEPLVRAVLETLSAREIELQDREGRWHMLRVRPYRTADNRIEGAVMALIDIDQVRRAQMVADAARDFAESVIESVQIPLLVLRSDLGVQLANRAFYQSCRAHPPEIELKMFDEICGKAWNVPGLRTALERVVTVRQPLEDFEFEQEFAGADTRVILVNARPVQPEGDHQILVSFEDITARRRAEAILVEEQDRLKRDLRAGSAALERTAKSLQTESLEREHAQTALYETEAALLQSRGELRALTGSLLNTQDEERRRVSRELHDDLSQKMAKLQFDVETIEQQLPVDPEDLKRQLRAVRDGAGALSDDLRRVAYQLHPSTLDHLGLTVALRSYIQEFSERERIQVDLTTRRVPENVPPEMGSSIYRIVQEALRNVAKHAGKATVRIRLTGSPNKLRLSIQDNGVGFDVRAVAGKGGLGLISIEERARLIRGIFSLKTQPGDGVLITIEAPLEAQGM